MVPVALSDTGPKLSVSLEIQEGHILSCHVVTLHHFVSFSVRFKLSEISQFPWRCKSPYCRSTTTRWETAFCEIISGSSVSANELENLSATLIPWQRGK